MYDEVPAIAADPDSCLALHMLHDGTVASCKCLSSAIFSRSGRDLSTTEMGRRTDGRERKQGGSVAAVEKYAATSPCRAVELAPPAKRPSSATQVLSRARRLRRCSHKTLPPAGSRVKGSSNSVIRACFDIGS